MNYANSANGNGRNNGIGFKLTAIMLCVILLGIAITISTTVVISGNSINSEALGKTRQSNLYETERVNNWLANQMTVVTVMADVVASMDNVISLITETDGSTSAEDRVADLLIPLFESVLAEEAEVFDVYMGFPDGSAVDGSGYHFDYSWWAAPERDWYRLALTDTSKAHVTSPYVDAQTEELCISVAHAVTVDGDVVGVMSADIFLTVLEEITLSADLDGKGYSMLIDDNDDILIHPNSDYTPSGDEFQSISTVSDAAYADMWKNVSASEDVFKYRDTDGTQSYFTGTPIESAGWHMLSVLPASVVTQPVKTLEFIVVPISVVIMVAAGLLIFTTIRSLITKPLVPLEIFMKKAGTTGDIEITPSVAEAISKYGSRQDEIGAIIASSAAFIRRVTDISATLMTVSNGDFTASITPLSDKDELGVSLGRMTGSLSDTFKDIKASTEQVSDGSKQISDGAQALAQGSTEQAASIEELSNTIIEISKKIKSNAETADKTSKLSETIKENAEKGNRRMGDMTSAVKDINDASQSIGKIIKTIDDIAFQTNILALNAAVEAARAGQHGKGFAVVAEEVRNLASKSAEAAKETGDMIQNSMEKAELGSRIAGETAASLAEIISGINDSGQLILEIARASEDQSERIGYINSGIDQVAQVVQQNSASAQESAAASEEMSSQSSMLREMISRFKFR